MPLVKIRIRKGRTDDEKYKLLDIVHSSLVEAFKIPDTDRMQLIIEYNKCDFEIPDYRTNKFTIIEITILPGCTVTA